MLNYFCERFKDDPIQFVKIFIAILNVIPESNFSLHSFVELFENFNLPPNKIMFTTSLRIICVATLIALLPLSLKKNYKCIMLQPVTKPFLLNFKHPKEM